MDCHEIKKLIPLYLDHELSEADRIEPVDDGKVDKILDKMGSKTKKKYC